MQKIFTQFTYEGIQYDSFKVNGKINCLTHSELGDNLLVDRYDIGLLQARFVFISTIVLPSDETKIICLN